MGDAALGVRGRAIAKPPASRHPAAEYAEAILVAVLLALFFKVFAFEAFDIPSGSMEPALLVGDHVLVDKLVHGPHGRLGGGMLPYRPIARGEILVFRDPEDPGRDLIKRVVGIPGDALALERKVLYVNGAPAQEPFAWHKFPEVYGSDSGAPEDLRRRDGFAPLTLGPGTYFMMGDNRDDSRDSRYWGPLPASLVKGRAVLVYWSYEQGREFTGRGAALRRLIDTALHFFGQTRWNRTCRRVR